MGKKSDQNTAAPKNQESEVDYLDQWKRTQAELDNLLKRSAKERSEAVLYARSHLLLELLPVVDNFERALAHVPDGESENTWLKGVTYIHKQLIDFLREQGVEKEEVAAGDVFDPHRHHAVQQVPHASIAADHVVAVITHPYTFNGELLRPGAVTVSAGAAEQDEVSLKTNS